MLAFVEQLAEVDIAGVEPMTSVMPKKMRQRADEVPTAASPPTSLGMRRRARTISSRFPKVVE
jgi:aspartyl-tRNA(Asn)/glutamyl-tRNA(Gln) amidotransferase subunit C